MVPERVACCVSPKPLASNMQIAPRVQAVGDAREGVWALPIEKPKIRTVESFPVDQDGQTYICLRDPTGIAPTPILIGMGAYFLVTLFDGTCSKSDLQTAFTKRFGEAVPSEHLDGLIDALDRGFFLDSPAYAARMDQ